MKQFLNILIFERCAKNVHIEKLMKTFFLKKLIVSLKTSMCNTKYLEERILILSSLAEKFQFTPAEECQVYFGQAVSNSLFWSIALRHQTQRKEM